MHKLLRIIAIIASSIIATHALAQTHLLNSGWSLIGNDNSYAIDPNNIFGNANSPTSITTGITTVWTWNNSLNQWNFFAPSMTPTQLSAYAASKQYSVLSNIQPGDGFWVNTNNPVSFDLISSSTLLSFPVRSGLSTLTANGLARSFSISGTCNGTGNRTTGPASTTTTFEGLPALSATSTITMNLVNCTPASTAQTSTNYVNDNYMPLGRNSVGVNYGLYQTPPIIPAFVSVGGTGIIGTEFLFTDSTKSTANGRVDVSFVVTADTSTTALITIIDKIYNAAGVLTVTEQDAWRIASTGALSPFSVDLQYSNGSTTHLLFTYH